MTDDGTGTGDEGTLVSPSWKPVVSIHSEGSTLNSLTNTGSISPTIRVTNCGGPKRLPEARRNTGRTEPRHRELTYRRVAYKKTKRIRIRNARTPSIVPPKTKNKIRRKAEELLTFMDAAVQAGPDMINEVIQLVGVMMEPPLTTGKLKTLKNEIANVKKELRDLEDEKYDMLRDLANLQSEMYHLEDDREDELKALKEAANAVKVATPSTSPGTNPADALGSWARELNKKSSGGGGAQFKNGEEVCKECCEPMNISNRWCPVSGARHRTEAEKEVELLRRRLSAIALEELSKGFIADGSIMYHSDGESPEPSPRRLSRQWLIDSVTLASPITLGDKSTPDSRKKHTFQFKDPYTDSDADSRDDEDSVFGAVFRKLSKKSSNGETPPQRPLQKARHGGNLKLLRQPASEGESPPHKPLMKVPTMPLKILEEGGVEQTRTEPVSPTAPLERKNTVPTLERKSTLPSGLPPMDRKSTMPSGFHVNEDNPSLQMERKTTMPSSGLQASDLQLERKSTLPSGYQPVLEAVQMERKSTLPSGFLLGDEELPIQKERGPTPTGFQPELQRHTHASPCGESPPSSPALERKGTIAIS